MFRIEVVVLVGMFVFELLCSKGLLVCWILMVDGVMWVGFFISCDEVEVLKGIWELSWLLEVVIFV